MSLQDFTQKPFSSSSEENKHVISEVIQKWLIDSKMVLEIASGTGQHAVHFAENMPFLTWQTSDLVESHSGINLWINESGLTNILPPLSIDVSEDNWPVVTYDAVYSANSFHIMSKQNVTDFFSHISSVLNPTGLVIIYGPFNYNGQFTSPSNANFDIWLKQRNEKSGIKDFEFCHELALNAGLKLAEDIEMPQNNRILIWVKK
ncbi:DUF938 domain-containing protein [Thiomicrorhabdus lithotrophica]|uniref:Class I SAM-dependent methyltransferase n=1 Tax=Thiomicrorhabdus lithotrophica TaxID=2949997 RepID=A0ABY8C6U8_9GAMM|nr:DUF938 domain-containing protein [Thiomicrorhabdus lithotrophica]WEJ61624.1 class I SAM-dependent methyltransferase [Thiomicrorhabdus lithotrophica]